MNVVLFIGSNANAMGLGLPDAPEVHNGVRIMQPYKDQRSI